jgi:hypothetical protein
MMTRAGWARGARERWPCAACQALPRRRRRRRPPRRRRQRPSLSLPAAYGPSARRAREPLARASRPGAPLGRGISLRWGSRTLTRAPRASHAQVPDCTNAERAPSVRPPITRRRSCA